MRSATLHRFQFRILLSLLLVPASAITHAQNQPANQHVHGLWVWKTPTVLAAPNAAATLRGFCRSQHITEVYVAFTAAAQAGPSEENQVAGLIRELHNSNIQVEALLSSTDADEPGKPREKLLSHVRQVLAFNQNHPNRSFDGIHLDIEPQQRPENKGPGNLNFLPGLVDAYRAVNRLAEPARLTVNADIQNKLLKGDSGQRQSMLTALPRLTLMLYEISSPNDGESTAQQQEKLRNAAQKYMEMAYQGIPGSNLARMAIGLRTPDYGAQLPLMLQTVDDSMRGNPHYLGWAWHSYALS
jgi:hypothetical protein